MSACMSMHSHAPRLSGGKWLDDLSFPRLQQLRIIGCREVELVGLRGTRPKAPQANGSSMARPKAPKGNGCMDTCVDLCVDMRVDMWTDMCTDM